MALVEFFFLECPAESPLGCKLLPEGSRRELGLLQGWTGQCWPGQDPQDIPVSVQGQSVLGDVRSSPAAPSQGFHPRGRELGREVIPRDEGKVGESYSMGFVPF